MPSPLAVLYLFFILLIAAVLFAVIWSVTRAKETASDDEPTHTAPPR